MMKKLFLTLLLMFSAANLTISAYAAMCQGPGGARACGTTCTSAPSGECLCTGTCSKEERDWVGGAKGGGDEEFVEELQ